MFENNENSNGNNGNINEDAKIQNVKNVNIEELKEEVNALIEKLNWDKKLGMIITSWRNTKDLARQFWNTQPFFYDKAKLWWLWNNKKMCYIRVDETDILNAIDKAIDESMITTTSQMKNEILEALKRVGRESMPKNIEKEYWVQFGDVIIDVKNWSIMKANPKYFITNPIPHTLGKSTETPTLDKLFEDWVGKDYVKTLYQIVAYSCLPAYPIHRVFCLNGSGCNGKTTFLNFLTKFLGEDNVVSSSLERIINNRFETSILYRKLLCVMGETNFSIISKTDILKRLVGEDKIFFEFKNKDTFSARNYAKIIIATNSLPATTDKTLGFYRKWLIIDFPNRFEEGKDILSEIPDVEYRNLARKCLLILKNLLQKGKFHNEGSIEDRKKKFEEISNPVHLFIEKRCVEDPNEMIKYSEFYQEFLKFVKENKLRKLSRQYIRKLLDLEGYMIERKHTYDEEGNRTTEVVIEGLKWRKYEEKISKFTTNG